MWLEDSFKVALDMAAITMTGKKTRIIDDAKFED
jgi:hypothetical protein